MMNRAYWIKLYGMMLACLLTRGALGAEMIADPPAVPGPVTTVEMHMGLPTFMVNGQPHIKPIFETYAPSVHWFSQFALAGCDVYGIAATSANEPWEHSTPTWVGRNVWDYSEFDERIAMILAADPKALIVPRIHVAEPDWWREENPGELMVYDDGTTGLKNPHRLWPALKTRTFASLASKKWREDMSMSLRHMIEHIQNQPYAKNIFGYQIFGLNTEEWYHITMGRPQMGDYSIHMQRYFRDWLRKKYGTTEALRAAWGRPEIEFEQVVIPGKGERQAGSGERAFRDPSREMPVIDFYQCWNEIIPEVIDLFCGVVKEASARTKVVGAFYAYMYEFCGNPESGHMAVQKLLASKNCDFIVVTASYGSRQLGTGGSILRSPHTSLKLHGKLWHEDNDNVSFLFDKVVARMGDAEATRSREVLAATNTAEESKWIYERGAGFTLGNGLYQSFFDLHGGYFDDPVLIGDIKNLYALFAKAIQYDRTSVSQILVVADELSTMYCTANSALLKQNLYDPPYRMIKMGAPYDSIYVDDLARIDLSPYKLVVFLNAWNLSDAQRALVEKVKGGGRTVLWCTAPGLFNGAKAERSAMSKLTGFQFAPLAGNKMIAPQIRLLAGEGLFTNRLIKREPTVIGPDGVSSPSFALDFQNDAGVEGLGCNPGTRALVLGQKKMNDWTSVYSITASLPPDFWRELARSAGVHVYNDRDDTLYVSQSYLTINADGAGRRTLRFPAACTILDPYTDKIQATSVTNFDLTLRDKETRILRLDRQHAK